MQNQIEEEFRVQRFKGQRSEFRSENRIEINKYVYCELEKLWNKYYGLCLIYTVSGKDLEGLVLVSNDFKGSLGSSLGHFGLTPVNFNEQGSSSHMI